MGRYGRGISLDSSRAEFEAFEQRVESAALSRHLHSLEHDEDYDDEDEPPVWWDENNEAYAEKEQ